MTQIFDYKGGETSSPLLQDYWKLLKLMLEDTQKNNPNGIVLMRFDKLHDFAENIWNEVHVTLASIINCEAHNVLEEHDLILGFDDASYVIIAGKDNKQTSRELGERLSNSIGLNMMGNLLEQSSIDLWQVTNIVKAGIEVTKIEGDEPFVQPVVQAPLPRVVQEDIADLNLIGTASFDFLPIWHVRRNMVMSFECVPRWHLDTGETLDEADLSARFRKHDMEYALDAETIHHAVDQVVRVMEHDAMATIVIPIHYDTIVDDIGFQKFLQAYSELMPLWRERVSMEIKCIPEDASFEYIRFCVQRLRPYCEGLYLQVPFGFDKIADFSVDGLVSIGLDLTHDLRDESDIIADMESFIARISEVPSLHSHALGLKTLSLSVAAICAGFDFIGCHPIAKELEGWGLDDFLIKPIDLYKQLLKSKS